MGGTTLFRPFTLGHTGGHEIRTSRSYDRAYGIGVDVKYIHGRETVTEMRRLAPRDNDLDTCSVTSCCDKSINKHASVHDSKVAPHHDREAVAADRMATGTSARR